MQELINLLLRNLDESKEEAAVAILFGIAGFTLDGWFFVGGFPPGIVTTLSAGTGYVSAKLFKTTSVYQNIVLSRIDSLLKKGHIDKDQAKKMKSGFVKSWYSEEKKKRNKKKKRSKNR